MTRLQLAFPLFLALASCSAPGVRLTDMTPAEILAYNRTVEYLNQVYCSERVGTASHIRRRECTTYRDLVEGRIGTLDTPSSSYSATR